MQPTAGHRANTTLSEKGAWQSVESGSEKVLWGYRFAFNGKENDNEVHGATGTFQDYGMRAYDTRIGRPITLDPIASSFPELSPYQFFSNNPVLNIDLDGLEGVVSTRTTVVFGIPIVTKTIELDIYVAISDQKGSVHYKRTDIARIAKDYRQDYPSDVFKSEGLLVDFRFTLHEFNMDELPSGTNGANCVEVLEQNPNNYKEGIFKAILLERNSIGIPNVTGQTVYGHETIDPSSIDARRSRRHEMGHSLTKPWENTQYHMGGDPIKHADFGGVFIGESLNQRNVDDFINALPEASPTKIEIKSFEEKKGL